MFYAHAERLNRERDRMSRLKKFIPLRVSVVLAVALLTAFAAVAQDQPKAADQQEESQLTLEMQLVSKNASITAVVGEEDGEGLWVVTADGTNYAVFPPDDISIEALSAFQTAYVNKEVTLIGDVFKDKYGNLNLFVKSLPK